MEHFESIFKFGMHKNETIRFLTEHGIIERHVNVELMKQHQIAASIRIENFK